MRCPNCGSENIIWDYVKGYSVCASCGLVLEQLYEEILWYAKAEENFKSYETSNATVREAMYKKRSKIYEQSMRRKMHIVSLYEHYAKRARKNLVVNIENLRNGRGRIYTHVKEPELQTLINQDAELKNILENIVNKDPILSSRTFRGKVALALMIRCLIHGTHPNVEEISKVTGISRTHARRLWSMIKDRFYKVPLST